MSSRSVFSNLLSKDYYFDEVLTTDNKKQLNEITNSISSFEVAESTY